MFSQVVKQIGDQFMAAFRNQGKPSSEITSCVIWDAGIPDLLNQAAQLFS